MTDLESELRELGAELLLPESPDVVARVSNRLAENARVVRRRRRTRLGVALALALAAVGAALAVPPVRAALLDALRIAGVELERAERLPETDPTAPLVPGRRVSFADAERAVAFRISAPPPKRGCRRCGEVYLDRTIPGGRVSIVWPGERPRLVLMQFRGTTVPFITKTAGSGTRLRQVDVAGVLGYWITGERHAVVFRDARGRILFGRRLADNVLLWERGGVTYRLEGDVTLARALRLANSLR